MKEGASQEAKRRWIIPHNRFALTPREIEVVTLRAQGFTADETGKKLVPEITENTVKTHTKQIADRYNRSGFPSTLVEIYRRNVIDVQEVAEDMDTSAFDSLTRSERTVMHAFLNTINANLPYRNKDIGSSLFLAPATVSRHLHNIYVKTNTSNLAHAITGYISWKIDKAEQVESQKIASE